MSEYNSQKEFVLIGEIQAIRTKNNVLWMDLLRLAMRYNPVEAKKILYQITQNDSQITYLTEQMVKE